MGTGRAGFLWLNPSATWRYVLPLKLAAAAIRVRLVSGPVVAALASVRFVFPTSVSNGQALAQNAGFVSLDFLETSVSTF